MPINIESFGISVIRIIDEIRSTGADPNNVDNNSAIALESRINALYRAIGLPAFKRIKGNKKKKPQDEDEHNVSNIFTNVGEEANNKFIDKAEERDNAFLNIIDKDKQKKFLDNLADMVLLDSLRKREKGSLFPMITNGDLKIYPQSKRVAGAFFKKDYMIKKNNIVYRRPLIELIVLLRLRSGGGGDDTANDKIKDGFADLEKRGFFEGSSENILTLGIITSLIETMTDPQGVIKDINKTMEDLGKLRVKYRETYKDQRINIINAQPVSAGSDGLGADEEFEKIRQDISRENEGKLALLDFEDIYGNKTKNMRDVLIAPLIVDILLSDTTFINEEIEKTELKKEKAQTKQKALWKQMDIILGTFSGISSIDILSIITALFTISQENLLGLLNSDSITRLESIKEEDLGVTPAKIIEAISALEEKVEEIYNSINDGVTKIDLLGQGKQEENFDKK